MPQITAGAISEGRKPTIYGVSPYLFFQKDSSQKTTIPCRARNRIAEKSKIEWTGKRAWVHG